MAALDIRLPIGLLFCILGLLLIMFGLASDPSLYQRSLGINVNLWWGTVLVIAGAFMLFLSYRRLRKQQGTAQTKPEEVTGH